MCSMLGPGETEVNQNWSLGPRELKVREGDYVEKICQVEGPQKQEQASKPHMGDLGGLPGGGR